MANSYLSRTPSGAGSRVKWTYSVWLKRSKLGHQPIWAATTDSNNYDEFYFNSSDKIQFSTVTSGTQKAIRTSRIFRDTSAWYHIVLVYDTGNSTDTDHAQLWINGVRETSFEDTTLLASGANNVQSNWNNNIEMKIGRVTTNTAAYFEGYMSHAAFVNDAVIAPTVFGETNSTSGIWKFKSPSGVTWGTNGFHLKMENSGAMGTDSSGQTNNFTVNGNLKQALDTPSNVYATLNRLSNYRSNQTFSYGNNKIVSPGDRHDFAVSTLGMNVGSGKFYAEFKLIAAAGSEHVVVGISDHYYMGSNEELGQENYSIAYINGGTLRSSNTNVATGVGTYTAGDIIGVAIDMDNLKIYWHKNGTYVNSGVPTSGSTGTGAVSIHNINTSPNSNSRGQGNYFFAVGNWHSGASSTWEANFGNGLFGITPISSAGSNGNGSLFEYDVPSGYYALNTKNINTYG
jgi:hypothetical protein